MQNLHRALEALQGGRVDEAETLCKKVLDDRQQRADALHILGLVAHHRGQSDTALARLGDAVDADPDNLERRVNLGLLELEAGTPGHAVAHFRAVLEEFPTSPEVLGCLGNALKKMKRFDEAIAAHERAVAAAPESASAWNDLAATYLAWDRPEAAAEGFRVAVSLLPDEAEVHFNLGTSLLAGRNFGAAVRAFRDAVARDSRHARAHMNLGIALKSIGEVDDARVVQRRAVAIDPDSADAQWNLALTELHVGDFASGWPRYEHRRRLPGYPAHPGHPWLGAEAQDKTLVLYAEQGMGDAIQFVRFVPEAAERVGRVVLRCPARLVQLMTGSYSGLDAVEALDAEASVDELWAPLMSLPALLGLGGDLGVPGPYLEAERELVAEAWQNLGDDERPRVGIAWQGNPSYRADAERSIPLEALTPVLESDAVRFLSFQKFHGHEQLAELRADLKVEDVGAEIDVHTGAFVETAAYLVHLDVFITTDSAIAHLAGALGVETWLMLPHSPDWRWGQEGEETVWYPSVTLFREPTPGNREGLILDIRAALDQRFGRAS